MSTKDKNLLLHVILLLLISALMGGLFPLIKIAEQTITPLTLAGAWLVNRRPSS
jgi:hypothetical protein